MAYDRAKAKREARLARAKRVGKKVRGTSERPRLTVFRSAKNIYAQLIDDNAGRTLSAASSREEAFRAEQTWGGNVAAAKTVGRIIAEKAAAQGITTVVFDRNGFLYHGRVKALADAAREKGLTF
ncbi:MAG: 50S ribosomal protein L18 [bacterium]|nr:50S ribosomal protein L18 [bacterium]MCZ6700936.1 50S ribosomal protein L18 [bacterium]MDV2478983.1 50S ribosomal protein L18 [bacterium]